jgi:hypothetical protein
MTMVAAVATATALRSLDFMFVSLCCNPGSHQRLLMAWLEFLSGRRVTELFNHTRFDFRGYPPPHPRTQVRFPLMAEDARLLLAGGAVRCRENGGPKPKDPSRKILA